VHLGQHLIACPGQTPHTQAGAGSWRELAVNGGEAITLRGDSSGRGPLAEGRQEVIEPGRQRRWSDDEKSFFVFPRWLATETNRQGS
jgi:hypothetical protein